MQMRCAGRELSVCCPAAFHSPGLRLGSCVAGGAAGSPAEYVLVRDGMETRLGAKATIELEPGDVISIRTCGGGGYGSPGDRDPELVAADVREGKLGVRRAREVYGWR